MAFKSTVKKGQYEASESDKKAREKTIILRSLDDKINKTGEKLAIMKHNLETFDISFTITGNLTYDIGGIQTMEKNFIKYIQKKNEQINIIKEKIAKPLLNVGIDNNIKNYQEIKILKSEIEGSYQSINEQINEIDQIETKKLTQIKQYYIDIATNISEGLLKTKIDEINQQINDFSQSFQQNNRTVAAVATVVSAASASSANIFDISLLTENNLTTRIYKPLIEMHEGILFLLNIKDDIIHFQREIVGNNSAAVPATTAAASSNNSSGVAAATEEASSNNSSGVATAVAAATTEVSEEASQNNNTAVVAVVMSSNIFNHKFNDSITNITKIKHDYNTILIKLAENILTDIENKMKKFKKGNESNNKIKNVKIYNDLSKLFTNYDFIQKIISENIFIHNSNSNNNSNKSLLTNINSRYESLKEKYNTIITKATNIFKNQINKNVKTVNNSTKKMLNNIKNKITIEMKNLTQEQRRTFNRAMGELLRKITHFNNSLSNDSSSRNNGNGALTSAAQELAVPVVAAQELVAQQAVQGTV
jgi:hypothetical protein